MRWHGETVCIMASGPSLTSGDADYARCHADRVIVINETWRMCPNADVLYGADCKWWTHRAPPPDEFKGERWTQQAAWTTPFPEGLQCFKSRPGIGISPPGSDVIFTGHNSAFQALGLAVAWGSRYVVFLGLDLGVAPSGARHWHGDHVAPLVNGPATYDTFRGAFEKAAPMLKALNVHVLNASRETTLTAFPRVQIVGAL